MSENQSIDLLSKILLVISVIILSYIALFSILAVLFASPQSSSVNNMMHHMMSFSPNFLVINLASLSLALLAGVLVSLWLTTEKTGKKMTQKDELEIIKRALSEDERAVLDEIKRAGEITQDSLRFRLGWTKSKLSRILTNLDKMNIIQRERIGKTYNVFLAGKRENSEETI